MADRNPLAGDDPWEGWYTPDPYAEEVADLQRQQLASTLARRPNLLNTLADAIPANREHGFSLTNMLKEGLDTAGRWVGGNPEIGRDTLAPLGLAALAPMTAARGSVGAFGGKLGDGKPRIDNPIRAYHGSPHDFDEFSLSKIGTGEGAQAYGHGLYFAEKEGVARDYRDKLSSRDGSLSPTEHTQMIADLTEKTQALIARWDREPQNRELVGKMLGDAERELRWAQSQRPSGKMYEVSLHARPEQFLDWDKPLSGQPEAIRQALEPHRAATAKDWEVNPTLGSPTHTGQVVAGVPDKQALADSLREAGIPGIRYLDQGSRGAGSGTSNYVVWTPEIIEILRKYGLLAPVAGSALANTLAGEPEQ
jgi:hypothetical protein